MKIIISVHLLDYHNFYSVYWGFQGDKPKA